MGTPMLRFERLENGGDLLQRRFSSAQPFEDIAIDDFCDEEALVRLDDEIPDPITHEVNKSGCYMFSRNTRTRDVSPELALLCADLMSERFQPLLQRITVQAAFVDPAFHGGGIHQGGEGSFLDMHVDFNTHPLQFSSGRARQGRPTHE
jgi:hypothetical protein